MRERFGARNPGSDDASLPCADGRKPSLTAQQPENNIVRVAIQSLAARAGGLPVAAYQTGSTKRSRCPPRAPRSWHCARSRLSRIETGVASTVDSGRRLLCHRKINRRNRIAREGLHRENRCAGRDAACDRNRLRTGRASRKPHTNISAPRRARRANRRRRGTGLSPANRHPSP